MSLMLTVCHCGSSRLRLEWERFDTIDRVFVGKVVCESCGTVYIDQRKPTQVRPYNQPNQGNLFTEQSK